MIGYILISRIVSNQNLFRPRGFPKIFWYFEIKKHCIRSNYDHCKDKTENEIVKIITDYIKYHKSSYAVYKTFRYQQNGRSIDVSFELLKYVGLGNYISIGKGFKIMEGIHRPGTIGPRTKSSGGPSRTGSEHI